MIKHWMRLTVWLFGAEAVVEEAGRIVWNPIVEHADRVAGLGEMLREEEAKVLEREPAIPGWDGDPRDPDFEPTSPVRASGQ